MRIREATPHTFRHPQPAAPRQGLDDQFPATHVMLVAHAGKLGDPQVSVRIDDAGLGPGAAQGTTGRDQQAQPVVAFLGRVVFIAFQRQAGGLQFAQLHERRCCNVVTVVQKVTAVIEPESERARAKRIMHTQEIVGFVQACIFGRLSCPFFPFQTPLHEHATPTIRTGIGEDPKGRVTLRWMLASREQPKPRIELKGSQRRMRQRSRIELEHFPSCSALHMKQTEPQRMRQTIPISVNSDGHLNASSSAQRPWDRSDRPGSGHG